MEVSGIIHCHSSYSYDAKLSLDELKVEAMRRGLSFICMTEHTDELTRARADAFVRECEERSDASFRFIPGFEVPYQKGFHILMIGARDFLGSYAPDIDALRVWTRHVPFVVLAHPVRNHFEVNDDLCEMLNGIEVWNQQYEGKRVPRSRSLVLYDKLKQKKPSLVATGGIDLHRIEHFGSPIVVLNVEDLTEEAIMARLIAGNFTVRATHISFQGMLADPDALARRYRWRSMRSVCVITLGKAVNRLFKRLGISLPKNLIARVRRRV